MTVVADLDAPVEIAEVRWPCLMLGPMLFSRAGCAVRAGRRALDPDRATSSVLHWATRRRNRPCVDLSQGWGHNSLWRTPFRRDYQVGGALRFNVDGRLEAGRAPIKDERHPTYQDGLAAGERIELLTHRCFVRTHKPDDDLWPWDDRLTLADEAPGPSV